jgi:hypothetical protein
VLSLLRPPQGSLLMACARLWKTEPGTVARTAAARAVDALAATEWECRSPFCLMRTPGEGESWAEMLCARDGRGVSVEEYNDGLAVGDVLTSDDEVADVMTRMLHRGHLVTVVLPWEKRKVDIDESALWAWRTASALEDRIASGDSVLSAVDFLLERWRLQYAARRLRTVATSVLMERCEDPLAAAGEEYELRRGRLVTLTGMVEGFVGALGLAYRNKDLQDRQVMEAVRQVQEGGWCGLPAAAEAEARGTWKARVAEACQRVEAASAAAAPPSPDDVEALVDAAGRLGLAEAARTHPAVLCRAVQALLARRVWRPLPTPPLLRSALPASLADMKALSDPGADFSRWLEQEWAADYETVSEWLHGVLRDAAGLSSPAAKVGVGPWSENADDAQASQLRLEWVATARRWRVVSLMLPPNITSPDMIDDCSALLDYTIPIEQRAQIAKRVLQWSWGVGEGEEAEEEVEEEAEEVEEEEEEEEEAEAEADANGTEARAAEEARGEEGGETDRDILIRAGPECIRLLAEYSAYNGDVKEGDLLDHSAAARLITRLLHDGHSVNRVLPPPLSVPEGADSIEAGDLYAFGRRWRQREGILPQDLWAWREAERMLARVIEPMPDDVLTGPDCVWLPSRLRLVIRRLGSFIESVREASLGRPEVVPTICNIKYMIAALQGFEGCVAMLCRTPDFYDRQVDDYVERLHKAVICMNAL